ncbi:hypothetical protein [Nonomuraea aridisoli]|uniref:Uncharacterized protein n=1 Tax=Nonomuraea aridisoli TaxID=2070368 RepID=A0A2W2F839_9ACTN|nr:hypothetical protein [Nonomuraea aridisoli]PZG21228.1 hypothetical protein C1J01_07155 [Nonomuraea aridisoli]
MSSLLRSLTDEVRPEYRLFAVASVIDGQLVGSAVDGEMDPPDERVAAGHDGLIIRTAYYGDVLHTIHNGFERWDGPPPVDDWEELWTGRLSLRSELIGAEPWAADYLNPHRMEFDLGQGDTTWSTRVTTKILRTEQEPGFPNAFARIELYKIQFWV